METLLILSRKRAVILYSFSILVSLIFLNIPITKKEFIPGLWFVDYYFKYLTNSVATFLLFLGIIIVLCLYKSYAKPIGDRINCFLALFSLLFSGAVCLGKSYNCLSNWNLLLGSRENFLFGIVIFAAVFFSSFFFLKTFYVYWVEFSTEIDERNTNTNYDFNTKFFALCLAIEVLYIVAFYPGSATHDGVFQITQFMGYERLSNHHPAVSTLIMGSIFAIGNKLIDANFGVFLYVCFQLIIQAVVFTKCVKLISNLTNNKNIMYLSSFYFLINPLFPTWGITFVKDSLYYIAMLWFMITIVNIYEKQYHCISSQLIQLLVSSLLVVNYRTNGVLVIVPTLILLYYLIRKEEINPLVKKAVFLTTVAVTVFYVIMKITLSLNHIVSPKVEAMTIPLQQVARVVHLNKDLTPGEQSTIHVLFGGKDIGKLYKPELSNPIKANYKSGTGSTKKFLKIYLALLKRYPTTYIEAVFNQYYGYLYPLKRGDDGAEGVYGFPKADYLHNDKIVLYRPISSSQVRNFISSAQRIWYKFPILELTYNCSFYIWGVLFIGGITVMHRKKEIWLVFLPVILTIGVAFISPNDACIRYLLPIIASVPLLLSYSIALLNTSESRSRSV